MGSRSALPAWDRELALHGIALMADRAAAVDELAERFAARADELGLDGDPSLAYRPRSRAADADALAAELAERLDGDLERGFTGHGPHRDDLALRRDGHELRAYGSQGQQRLALLALLLAEREAIGATRGAAAAPAPRRRHVRARRRAPRAGSSTSWPARGRPSSRRPSSSTCPAPTARRPRLAVTAGAVLEDRTEAVA